jgi:hypothetical protein
MVNVWPFRLPALRITANMRVEFCESWLSISFFSQQAADKGTVHFAYEPSNRYLALLRLFQVLTNWNVTIIFNKKDWTAIFTN